MAYKVKKSTVQLTALLDLLFVMIFVSLTQQKQAESKAEPTPKPKPVQAKPVAKPLATPKPAQPKKIVYRVQATFDFYPTPSNPVAAKGTYLMQGSYDTRGGELKLGGLSWINRPENYDMVPLNGVIKEGLDIFRGRIPFQGCEQFTLRREERLAGSPIAGKWVGTYKCTQGETGLTLTLD